MKEKKDNVNTKISPIANLSSERMIENTSEK